MHSRGKPVSQTTRPIPERVTSEKRRAIGIREPPKEDATRLRLLDAGDGERLGKWIFFFCLGVWHMNKEWKGNGRPPLTTQHYIRSFEFDSERGKIWEASNERMDGGIDRSCPAERFSGARPAGGLFNRHPLPRFICLVRRRKGGGRGRMTSFVDNRAHAFKTE